MKSKIQVSFNQVQYEVNLKSLQENVNRYNNYINAIYKITNSIWIKVIFATFLQYIIIIDWNNLILISFCKWLLYILLKEWSTILSAVYNIIFFNRLFNAYLYTISCPQSIRVNFILSHSHYFPVAAFLKFFYYFFI